MRFRYCDNPSPSNGGEMCKGERLMEEACNTEKCPGKVSKSENIDGILQFEEFKGC